MIMGKKKKGLEKDGEEERMEGLEVRYFMCLLVRVHT